MKKCINIPENMTRLEALRTLKGLTQDQLAETLGMNKRTYVKLEKDFNGKIGNLIKLSNYWNVSCDYLLGNEKINVCGLSTEANKTLEYLKMYDIANGNNLDYLPLLDKLLSSHQFTWDILHLLDLLLNLDGTLALHKNRKDIFPDENEVHSFRIIHKDNPNAYTALNVKNLIEANTYDQIKNIIADFVKNYNK